MAPPDAQAVAFLDVEWAGNWYLEDHEGSAVSIKHLGRRFRVGRKLEQDRQAGYLRTITTVGGVAAL